MASSECAPRSDPIPVFIPREAPLPQFVGLIEMVIRRCWGSRDLDHYEDLRQVAWIAAWLAVKTYIPNRGTTIQTYVYQCAYHAVLNADQAYRHDHQNSYELEEAELQTTLLQTDRAEEVKNWQDWSPTRFLESLSNESSRAAYRQLNDIDQKILAWSVGGQATNAQIGNLLLMEMEAVKKRRQRALRHMESCYQQSVSRSRRQRVRVTW